MSCLHLIRTQIATNEHALVNVMPEQDACLLIDDGVYLITDDAFLAYAEQLNIKLFASKTHVSARALTSNEQVVVIDDAEITSLLLNYEQSLTWQ